jgi:hypothetical protein
MCVVLFGLMLVGYMRAVAARWAGYARAVVD